MSIERLHRVVSNDSGLAGLNARVVHEAALQGFDPGHDLSHAYRVADWTLRLSPSLCERDVIAAALLHDVVNLPKNHVERNQASRRSAAFARTVLPGFDFAPDAISHIADAVEFHSYSRGGEPKFPLGRALRDADRLETLGAIGLMRVFSTGAKMGASYFDETDPWAERRTLDDLRFSIDHFEQKLFRLPATMLTNAGRQESERRVLFMRTFLEQLRSEISL